MTTPKKVASKFKSDLDATQLSISGTSETLTVDAKGKRLPKFEKAVYRELNIYFKTQGQKFPFEILHEVKDANIWHFIFLDPSNGKLYSVFASFKLKRYTMFVVNSIIETRDPLKSYDASQK